MIRWAALLLPLVALGVYDSGAVDYFAVKQLAVVSLAFVIVLAALRTPRLAFPLPLAIALMAVLAARGLELVRAPHSATALRAVSVWVALFAVFLTVTATTSRRFWRRRLPVVYGAAGLLLTVVVVLQATGAIPARQAHATFANRNFAAAGLAMLAPFAFTWRLWAGFIVVGGVVATGSRGGMLAAACAVVLWFAWRHPRRAIALGILPVIVLVAGLAWGETNTVTVRRHWYAAAWSMGAQQPLLGHGADGFVREYPPRRPLEEYQISGGRRVHAVHNDYLERFADGGALGLLSYLAWLALGLYSARRWRPAACSLLAFAVAGLADLPVHDPSLLALAIMPMAATASRGPRRRGAPLALAVALVALAALTPVLWWHVRADRAWGRVLDGTGNVDDVLAFEPRHLDALLIRGSQRDLEQILTMRPHHAAARRALAQFLPSDERPDHWRRILLHHDPHDVETRVALARHVMKDDRIQAVSLLDEAVRANPRAWRPHLLRAEVARRARRFDEADRHLRLAEERHRGSHPVLARERLDLEIDSMRDNEIDQRLVLYAVRRLKVGYTISRIEDALERARAADATVPAPDMERAPSETAAQFMARVETAMGAKRREMRARSRIHYLEALVIAEALTAFRPSVRSYRLRGQAARGLGELERARQMESLALFLETLEALRAGRETRARFRWQRAIAAHPQLPGERAVKETLGQFVAQFPQCYDAAQRVFYAHDDLRAAFTR